MNEKCVNTFLFSTPSGLTGMSSLLDLGATLRDVNSSSTSSEADIIALFTDWQNIGDDIRAAIIRRLESDLELLEKSSRGE